MAKGYFITPEVEALIVAVHHNNSKWKPKEVRLVVRNILLERSRKYPEKYPDLPLKLSKGWPSLSSVRSKAFSKSKRSPQLKDKPWSIATLSNNDYFIPPEAIPIVISFYKKRLSENDVLTIREALWAARLYKIIEPLDLVFDWAFIYAINELIADEAGRTFESREFDRGFLRHPKLGSSWRREIAIWSIATEYNVDPVELNKLNLSIEETKEIAKSGKYKRDGWDKPEVQNERKYKAKRQGK